MIRRDGGSSAGCWRAICSTSTMPGPHIWWGGAGEPPKENSRVQRHFMAGWIALRFLNDPATAAAHFARIQDASSHPTSLARAHYWLGRAAEAARRPDQ